MDELVSYLPCVTTHTGSPVTLRYWLEQTKHPTSPEFQRARDLIHQIRESTDPNLVKALKKSLPGITPGCLIEPMKSRTHSNISSLTGWMQVDVDCVADVEGIRDTIAKISYVAYSSISASGQGIWALVRVDKPELSKLYFRQLSHDLRTRGIDIDISKGANPTDFRFYSYDENAIIKSDYKVYDRLPKTVIIPPSDTGTQFKTHPPNVFENAYQYVLNQGYSFQPGDMHNSIYHFSCYLNRFGVPRSEVENWISRNILPLSSITTNCISYPYEHYAHEHGKWMQSRHKRIKKQNLKPEHP